MARVFCIDPLGMKNACTRNVLIRKASTSANTTRKGSSTMNGRGFFGNSSRHKTTNGYAAQPAAVLGCGTAVRPAGACASASGSAAGSGSAAVSGA